MFSGKAHGFWNPGFRGSNTGSAPTSCSIREGRICHLPHWLEWSWKSITWLSHGKSPSKPLDCFKAASFLSLCYRSITKRHSMTFFSSKGGKLDHYRNRWRKEERQRAIVFAEFLLNTRFLLWQWYPYSNWNIPMPHRTEKECRCRDGVKRTDVICPRAHCLWAHGWDECISTSRLNTLLVKELEMPAVLMKFSKRVICSGFKVWVKHGSQWTSILRWTLSATGRWMPDSSSQRVCPTFTPLCL